jgi:hypothetical protein
MCDNETIMITSKHNASSIDFDQTGYKPRSRPAEEVAHAPSIVRLLLKTKIIRSEKQAVILILVLSLLILGASAFYTSKSFKVSPAVVNPKLMSNTK